MSYSQYQRYGGSTQVHSVQQQQQQQQGLRWNGTAWVSVAPSASSASHSSHSSELGGGSYQAASSASAATADEPVFPMQYTPPTRVPPNAVPTYTEYYNGWQAIVKDYEQRLRRVDYRTPAAQREFLTSQLQWAQYYGDESSRAAHHFYEHPHTLPTTFQLPPAPPAVAVAAAATSPAPVAPSYQRQPAAHATNTTTATSSSSSSWASVAAGRAANQAPNAQDPSGPSDSLARYFAKCLGRCSSPDQKAQVQAEIEAKIAKSIQDGSFPRKDWDKEPLVEVPPTALHSLGAPHSSSSSHLHHRKHHSSSYDSQLQTNNSYYGHSGAETSPSLSSSRSKTAKASQASYYGPGSSRKESAHSFSASSSSSSPPTSSSSPTSSFTNYYSSQQTVSSSKRSLEASQEDDFLAFQKHKKKKKPGKKGKATSSSTTSTISNQYKYVNPDRLDGGLFGLSGGSNRGFEKSSQALARRKDRFSGAGGLAEASQASTLRKNGQDDDYDKYMGKSTIGGTGWSALLGSGDAATEEYAFERMTVKGTCQVLEKEYLRLTAPPRAELVRPKPILEEHLRNLQEEYYGPNGNKSAADVPKRKKRKKRKKRDYLWFCSQLKAVRQDLTIQRIRDAFAVEVYETHARIALREGDLNEFNQSQTQLKDLYDQLAKEEGAGLEHQEEFLAYRLLYHVLLTTNDKYEAGTSEISKILLQLTADGTGKDPKEDPSIRHAIQVREALASSDYLQFFRLHATAPHLGRYLTGRMVPTMRLRALRRIAKSYRPSIDVKTCTRVLLGFESVEEGIDWLRSCGCVLSLPSSEGNGEMVVLTKESEGAIHEPETETKNSLI